MIKRENKEFNRLFLDIDVPVGKPREFHKRVFGFYLPKWWVDYNFRELLELVEFEVRRLMWMFPLGRRALIYRSSWMGFHVIFPDAKLSFREVEAIQRASFFCHEGYRFFCHLVQDETLRVGERKGFGRPILLKVVEIS
jgi:hypothetical protein